MSPSRFAQMYLGDFTLNVMQFAHTSSYPSETLHIHCCHLVDRIGITTRVMAGRGTFLFHFKESGRKKFFSLYFLLSDVLCYILLPSIHISTNFSVSFQMVPKQIHFTLLLLSVHHICIVTLTISTCTCYLNQPDQPVLVCSLTIVYSLATVYSLTTLIFRCLFTDVFFPYLHIVHIIHFLHCWFRACK